MAYGSNFSLLTDLSFSCFFQSINRFGFIREMRRCIFSWYTLNIEGDTVKNQTDIPTLFGIKFLRRKLIHFREPNSFVDLQRTEEDV